MVDDNASFITKKSGSYLDFAVDPEKYFFCEKMI